MDIYMEINLSGIVHGLPKLSVAQNGFRVFLLDSQFIYLIF